MALEIIPRPDYISWEEITELLHKAFAERAEQGLNYTACTQSAEITRTRAEGGICLVALFDGKLIGTETIKIYVHKGKKIGYLSQEGILPEYKGQGIGTELSRRCIEICSAHGGDAIYCNTSEKASSVVNWFLKNGWQKIRLESYSTTNYYSIVFRYVIKGRKYRSIEATLRFFVSSIYCRIKCRENGTLRPIGKIIQKTKNYARDKIRRT